MAKKRVQKSIASLIGKREINIDEIDQAVKEVHKPVSKSPVKVQEKKTAKPPGKKPVPKPKPEKKVRVSVDTPQSLYLLAKGAALEEGISALKDFYLMCVQEHLKKKGKM